MFLHSNLLVYLTSRRSASSCGKRWKRRRCSCLGTRTWTSWSPAWTTCKSIAIQGCPPVRSHTTKRQSPLSVQSTKARLHKTFSLMCNQQSRRFVKQERWRTKRKSVSGSKYWGLFRGSRGITQLNFFDILYANAYNLVQRPAWSRTQRRQLRSPIEDALVTAVFGALSALEALCDNALYKLTLTLTFWPEKLFEMSSIMRS